MHAERLVRTAEVYGLRLGHAYAALEILERPWVRPG